MVAPNSIFLNANNAESATAAPIGATDTVLTLLPNTASQFPVPGVREYFVATLSDALTNSIREIVWVTNVTGDTLTIERGKEGTTPAIWQAGSTFSQLVTEGQLQGLVQFPQFYQFREKVVDVPIIAGVLTIDLTAGTIHRVTVDQNITSFVTSDIDAGFAQGFSLLLTANGTGFTQDWATTIWPSDAIPALPIANGAQTWLSFQKFSDGGLYGFPGPGTYTP